jgi:hypothetical protein
MAEEFQKMPELPKSPKLKTAYLNALMTLAGLKSLPPSVSSVFISG